MAAADIGSPGTAPEIAFLRELIAAQADGEAAVQAAIAGRLASSGCTVEGLDYDPSAVAVVDEFATARTSNGAARRAIVGTLEGDGSRASLMMFAHPDGEPVAGTERWSHDPFGGQVADGKLYGWGVADDLAGCAAAVLAMERIARQGASLGTVVFASTPSKRHARGVAALLHHGLRSDASLYLHPAESGVGMREIKAVCSGQLEFVVTVTGRQPETTEPGHTAFSHRAENPLDKAILLIDALKRLAEARAGRIHHPLIEAEVGRATNLHVSNIACGEMRRFSRIAETCAFGGAIAYPPGEAMAAVQAEFEAALTEAAGADPWLADHPPTIDWIAGVTGAEVPADHPFYQVTSAAVSRVTGGTPHVNPMHTSSDIRNPNVQAGIPCLGLGCLGGDLSQNDGHDEWVDVADFLRMVDVTEAVIADWCGRPKAAQP